MWTACGAGRQVRGAERAARVWLFVTLCSVSVVMLLVKCTESSCLSLRSVECPRGSSAIVRANADEANGIE
jgi:hypothetical protein